MRIPWPFSTGRRDRAVPAAALPPPEPTNRIERKAVQAFRQGDLLLAVDHCRRGITGEGGRGSATTLKLLLFFARLPSPETLIARRDDAVAFARWDNASELRDRIGDVREASAALCRSIARDRRAAMALLMATRLVLVHGAEEAFEPLAVHWRGPPPYRPDQEEAHLRLRLALKLHGPVTDGLFERLLNTDGPWSVRLTRRWLQHAWNYHGPDEQLVNEIEARLDRFGLWKDATAQQLAGLALELGLEDRVAGWIAAHPAVAGGHTTILALSHHLAERGPMPPAGAARKAVLEGAAIYDRLIHDEKAIAKRLRSAASVAVVGNGPSALGRRGGADIDAHDVVVRFNRFRLDPPYDVDYGTKVDLIVRSPESDPVMDALAEAAAMVVFNTQHILFRSTPRAYLAHMMKSTKLIGYMPVSHYVETARTVQAVPSAGLLFTSYLKSLRDRLDHRSFFGFAMTDQVGRNASSSHYFEQSQPTTAHNWRNERRYFDQLLYGAS